VECSSVNRKFFRVRTSCHITGYGVHPDIFWLLKSLELIDFDYNSLLYESIFICQVLPGCFSYDDLKQMEFDIYEKILKRAKDINGKEK